MPRVDGLHLLPSARFLVAADLGAGFSAAFVVGALLNPGVPGGVTALYPAPALVSLFLVGAFLYRDLYHASVYLSARRLFLHSCQCMALCFGGLLVVHVVTEYRGFGVLRLTALCFVAGASVMAWRFLFKNLVQSNKFRERILILGSGDLAKDVARAVLSREAPGFAIVGFIGPKELLGVSILNPKVVGTYETLPEVVERERVSTIVIAEHDRRNVLPMDYLIDHRLAGGKVYDSVDFLETTLGRVPLGNVKPAWFVFSGGFTHSRLYFAAQQAVGYLVAASLLLTHLPILAAIALMIKIDSRGPVFYRQKRVGKDGKIFWLYKFRSMRQDAEAGSGPQWAVPGDGRITRVGRIMRPLRLDELPQVLNVLRGDMNLIGPRPERPEFVERLSQEIPNYHRRHAVKPGVTGWAQVNYRYGASTDDARTKLEYDLFYIKHMSLSLDLFIIAKTIKTVLRPDRGK
jgi:sugar transferase (PEP-CTERM system associated)